MSNDIINFIRKQDDFFSAIKYFGGISNLKKIASNSPEVLELIDNESKGYMEFISDSKKKYRFDFHIEQVVFDRHAVAEHLYIFVDLIITQKNNQTEIADWVASYMEDMRPDYFLKSKSLSKYPYIYGEISKVNGKEYDYFTETNSPTDFEIEDLVKNYLIKESLEKLQKLFD